MAQGEVVVKCEEGRDEWLEVKWVWMDPAWMTVVRLGWVSIGNDPCKSTCRFPLMVVVLVNPTRIS